MRRFIIKHFVGDKVYRSNHLLIISEILSYIAVTCFIQGYITIGSIISALIIILFSIGMKVKKQSTSRHRASFILFPLIVGAGNMALLGIHGTSNILLVLFLILYLVPEIYLHFNKVKWEELSDEQKWQLGSSHWGFQTMTQDQKDEWIKLNENKYE